jgi:uncharacterized membrane protein
MTARQRAGQPRGWPVPAALVALSIIPLAAGSLRLVQLAGGPALRAADHRFTGFPGALVLHIVSATVFALLGALQFLPRFRRHHPVWHRRAGRLVAGAGLGVSGSALWLTLFYPPQPSTGTLLYVLRLGFACAMTASLLLGVTAARRHDVAAHRAWMIRAYAIGLAAGTQAFTQGVAEAIFGTGVALQTDAALGAGWVINLAVAEWAIRRASRPSPRRQPTNSPATRRARAGAPS